MADECCRCTSWNRVTGLCHEMRSPFWRQPTNPETACDNITKGEPMNFEPLRLCCNCKTFKRNKPNTPLYINGWWWGGPDGGLCKKDSQEYDPNSHRIMSDSCEHHELYEPLKYYPVPENQES